MDGINKESFEPKTIKKEDYAKDGSVTAPVKHVRETFVCSLCQLTEKYDYFGKTPPFCKAVIFNEDSYIMRDPFAPSRDNNANFLLLGSNCGVCSKPICQDCSLFFTKRICSNCSKEHANLLPEELRKKLNKGKQ